MRNFKDILRLNEAVKAVRLDELKGKKESVKLGEAVGNEKAPGKPETMAQKHGRMYPRGFKKRKEWVVYCREILKDWKSGDMALSRLESVFSDINHIGYGVQNFDTRGMTEPFDPKYIDAVGKAFKKSIGKMERVGRMGKTGYGFNPAMGKVTPNEITAYLQAVVDFCTGEWADLDKQYGIKESVENFSGHDGSPLQEAASIDKGKWYVKNEHPKDRSVVLIYGPYDSEAHADKDDSWETGGLVISGADLMNRVKKGKIVELGREKKIQFVKGK